MPELADSLRKAAILLSCLETDEAGGLLARLGGHDATQLRNAVALLGPIRADEQNTVIREFLQLTSPKKSQSSGVELDDQLIRRFTRQQELVAEDGPAVSSTGADAASPFAFLLKTEPEVIAPFLAQESPQTIAVVLSFLERQQASAILRHLDPALQSQVVQRLARLDDVEPECVEVVAAELRAWLERQAVQQQSNVPVKPAQQRREVLEDWEDAEEASLPPRMPEAPAAPADMGFDDMKLLTDAELLDVLRASPSEVLALALADADEALLRRITSRLPRREGKRLRKSINLQGPTRLADIEAAQQTIARIATSVVSARHGRF